MVQVRLLTSRVQWFAGKPVGQARGEVIEVERDEALRMIERGQAEFIEAVPVVETAMIDRPKRGRPRLRAIREAVVR